MACRGAYEAVGGHRDQLSSKKDLRYGAKTPTRVLLFLSEGVSLTSAADKKRWYRLLAQEKITALRGVYEVI